MTPEELRQVLLAYSAQLRQTNQAEAVHLQSQGVSPEVLEEYAQRSLAARQQMIRDYAQQLLAQQQQQHIEDRQIGRDEVPDSFTAQPIRVTPDGREDLGTLDPVNIPRREIIKDTSMTDYDPGPTSPEAIEARRRQKRNGGR